MSQATFDTLLALLSVRLEAFAMCEIDRGYGLRCDPIDSVVIHYVVKGEGTVECEHGIFPIRSGAVILIPKGLSKRINGPGPTLKVVDADDGCPLVEGMVKFRGGAGRGDLILGCASVTANVGEGFGLFDHLALPLVAAPGGRKLATLFRDILYELGHPQIGTKAVVETLMKQLLILLLRSQLEPSDTVPLPLPFLNPQLGSALMAIVSAPEQPHNVQSLARIAGMSRSRFAHLFASEHGRSPMDYVRMVRMRAAARMLCTSRLPVKFIAGAVGLASRSHFSRAFRREYGLDPTAFRVASAPDEQSVPEWEGDEVCGALAQPYPKHLQLHPDRPSRMPQPGRAL